MGRWIADDAQTLNVGANVAFDYSETCNCNVSHRTGSGLFTLHGGKVYSVCFSANVSGATAGTEVDLAIVVNGEVLPATRMASTPAVADDINNVSRCVEISVPCGCCYNLAIQNTGTTAITVSNAYLSIQKEK